MFAFAELHQRSNRWATTRSPESQLLPWPSTTVGQIVGISTFKGETAWHAFIWDGSMHDLGGALGGCCSQAFGINDAGEVVGFASLAGEATIHAALWRGVGNITDLGIVGGIYQCSSAHSINAKEQVVGESTDCGSTFHSFLWEGGSIVDLNALISSSPLVLASAQTINDRGEIAGTAFDASFNGHAFLLLPCDDNHPGIDGCDYSMVDAGTAATAVAAIPATKVASPFIQGNPAFRGAANPMLRRFGRPFGPWYRRMGAESPAAKPTRAVPTSTADAIPAVSTAEDCEANGRNELEGVLSNIDGANLSDTLDKPPFAGGGYCSAPGGILGGECVITTFPYFYKYDPSYCPPNAKAIKLGQKSCCSPRGCKLLPVDLARQCH